MVVYWHIGSIGAVSLPAGGHVYRDVKADRVELSLSL